MTHPRIVKASLSSQAPGEAAIKASCEKLGIEYIGDQPDHPIFKEGTSITFIPRSTPSKSVKPAEDSPTKPEPTEPPIEET
jgi:hypothetical protein